MLISENGQLGAAAQSRDVDSMPPTMTSKTTEYALEALVFLASRRGRPMSSATIAAGTGVPPSYLSKVLQALCRAGIVRSQRGPSGGFVLARDASGVTVLDVAQAVDGWDEPESEEPQRVGPVSRYLSSLAVDTQRAMQETTLAALASPGE